jgi:hypothetical protein
MTFTGLISDINAALAGMSFTPPPTTTARARRCRSCTSDQGNTGSGGAQSDSRHGQHHRQRGERRAGELMPPDQSTTINSTLTFSNATNENPSRSRCGRRRVDGARDADGHQRRLTLSTITGLSFTVGDGTLDTTMTFTGTVAAINTALNGMSFVPTAGLHGVGGLTITTNDLGNSGSGGALSDTDSIEIEMVNESRVNTTISNTSTSAGRRRRVRQLRVVWASNGRKAAVRHLRAAVDYLGNKKVPSSSSTRRPPTTRLSPLVAMDQSGISLSPG